MSDIVIDESWYKRTTDAPDRVAAGGVIVREENGVPLVALVKEAHYRGLILPKGGVEEGESIEEAARREIKEEAGVTELDLVEYLEMLERYSFHKRNWEKVHYFLFTTIQVDGHPTEMEKGYVLHWYSIDELPDMLWPEQKKLIEKNKSKIRKLLLKS